MSRDAHGDRPHERANRGRRLDRMTDLERQADEEKWDSIIKGSHPEEEEMEEGSEEVRFITRKFIVYGGI